MTKSNTSKIKSKLLDRGVPCIFLGYANDHAANVYQMLKLDTNTVIITRDIKWLRKLYWEYMGMTKLKKYQVEEDNKLSIVELIDKEEDEPSNKKVETDIIQNQDFQSTKDKPIPRWQQNLQTFYNPTRREDDEGSIEYGEMAFLSMLEGSMNEPKIFNQAWNHPNNKERKFWRQAITKDLSDMKKRGVWEIIDKNSIPKDQSLIGSKWVFKQKKNGIY